MKRIPIFFTFDDQYVKPAAVAFFSLLNRARKDIAYDMYVLHHDITLEHRQLLEGVVGRFPPSALVFVDTGDFLAAEWEVGNWGEHFPGYHFTKDTIVPCFAARLFPQYDRIIYSDVDVVFQDDISELSEFDCSDAYCAGVRGYISHDATNMSHLNAQHYEMLEDCYIAGGILVMNLKKIREDRIEDRMLAIAKDASIVKRWPDQDILNIACAGKVKFLPLNYIGYPYLRANLQAGPFDSPYTRDELYDSIICPKIMHFAGPKPWNADMTWAEYWWDIANYLELGVPRPEPPQLGNEGIRAQKQAKRRWRRATIVVIVALVAALIYLTMG